MTVTQTEIHPATPERWADVAELFGERGAYDGCWCMFWRLSAKDYPGILMDVSFDKNGDLDRESFMTKVVNGKQEVIATLPALSAAK